MAGGGLQEGVQDRDGAWGQRGYPRSRGLGESSGTREQLSQGRGQSGWDRHAKAQPGHLSSEPLPYLNGS